MPIAKIQLPDGRIGRFEVAEGTTPDQVLEFANNQFGGQEQQMQQPQERTPTQPTQYVERNTLTSGDISQGEALLTTATNVPFGPRIKAGLSAISAKAQGGDESISRFYDEALSNELSKLRRAREVFPKQSFASQLATDVIGGGAVLKGLGIAGNTAKQALKGGAVIGGTTALGETKDISNLPQSLTDLLAGSVAGSVGGVAGQQAGKALGKTSKALPSIIQKFKPNTPEKVLSQFITPEEAGQQAGELATKIEQGRITALPEQGNENILGLTRILGKTQGSNKIITSYINNKTATSAKRVGDLLNNNLSAESFFDNFDNLILKRQSLSAPIRQKAYEEGKNIPKLFEYSPSSTTTATSKIISPTLYSIDPLTGNKRFIPAKIGETVSTTGKRFNQKQAIMEYGGKFLSLKDRDIALEFDNLVEDPKIKQYVNTSIKDNEIQAPINSVEMLHDVRKQIDSDINGLYNAIQSKQASFNSASSTQSELSALNSLKKRLNNVIYKVSPSMKDHDKIYADSFALERSREEGLKFGKFRNGEEVKRYISGLSDGEKETHKIGVKEYYMDIIKGTSDRNSSARKIFSEPLEREKLEAVFNNPKQFNDFARRINDEIIVFDVKQRIVGGSKTDFNLTESNQLLDKVAKETINAKTFGISNVILTATDAIKKRYYGLNETIAKELANIIVNPQKSVEALNRIYQKSQTPQEKMLIQKFADNLANKNFTAPIASKLGRAMATEQLNNEENQNGI